MVVYADWRDVDALINHITNRNGSTFSGVGDTSTSADNRYSDNAIVSARRKAAVRILEAIGSNVSHPYWAELKSDVSIVHGQKIPAHFGEIGLPQIAPFVTEEMNREITNGVKAEDDNTLLLAAGTGAFDSNDVDRRIVIEYVDTSTGVKTTVIDADVATVVDADQITLYNYRTGGPAFSVVAGTGWTVLVTIYQDSAIDPADGLLMTGIPADPDEIESYRSNTKGVFGDLFGQGSVAHDEPTSDGFPSPLSLRYSTDNGVLKFTGAACFIPMIQKPFEDLVLALVDENELLTHPVTAVNGSPTITSPDGLFPDWVDGLNLVVNNGAEILNQAVTWNSLTEVTAAGNATGATTTGIGTFTGTLSADAAFRRMLDLFIPVDLSSLLVKLALPLLAKEGDNLFRTAAYLGQEGERELMGVRAGGIKIAPVNPKKLIELSQQMS
jgi:hypothetical protein